MINTIFYFVETDAEYQLKRAQGEISNKTIVFVEDTREIYINGRGYGKTSTAGLVNNSEFEQWKNTIQGIITNLQSEAAQKDQKFADTLERELNAAKAELQQLITAADNRVSAVSNELNSFTSGLDSEIQGAVSDAISDALTNYRDEDAWTEINNTKAGLSTVTNKVNNITDSEGNIKYSVVQSAINTGIENNQAFTDISNRWATAEENQAVLEWLAGGFKSQVSEGTSFASVYAAEKSATGSAISQMKTEVLGDIENGYVSKTSLASSVTDIVKDGLSITSLADIALQSDITSATNTLQTTFNNSISQIQQKSTEQDARLDLLTTVTTPAGSQNSVVSINEANLDQAMARILATSGSAAASQINIIAEGSSSGVDIQSSINSAVATATAGMATTAYVDGAENRVSSYLKDSQGNIITSASLQNAVTADHSTLTALSTTVNGLQTAQAGLVTQTGLGDAVASLIAQNGDVRSAITTYVNGDTSNITLSADQIYLDADKTLANTIEASQGNIGGYTISSNGLEATNTTTGNGIAITTDHIQTVKNNVPTNNFNADGSGFIATGGISWNNNGTLTLSQEFLRSLFAQLGNGAANGLTYGGVSESMYSEVPVSNPVVWLLTTDSENRYNPSRINSLEVTGMGIYAGISNDYTILPYYVPEQNGYTQCNFIFNGTVTVPYGSIIVYGSYSGSSQGDQFYLPPVGQEPTGMYDPVQQILNKVYKWKLTFDRGILVKKEKADVKTLKTETELSASDIYERVYLFSTISSETDIKNNIDKMLEYSGGNNIGFTMPTGTFRGIISFGRYSINSGIQVKWEPMDYASGNNGDWIILKDLIKGGTSSNNVSNYYGTLFEIQNNTWVQKMSRIPLYKFIKYQQ